MFREYWKGLYRGECTNICAYYFTTIQTSQNRLRSVSELSQYHFSTLLISLVFSGRLISRSNVYNSLYFVSLRVQRVLKGSVPRRMHRHMRLLFHHTDSKLHPSRDTSRDPKFHTSSYGDTPSHQRRRPNNHNSRGHGGTAAAAQSANTASTGAQRSIWRKILPTWRKKVFQSSREG